MQTLTLQDEVFHSIPAAARMARVSRMTMFKWAVNAMTSTGIRLKVIHDPATNRYYVSEQSVRDLVSRFQPVVPGNRLENAEPEERRVGREDRCYTTVPYAGA